MKKSNFPGSHDFIDMNRMLRRGRLGSLQGLLEALESGDDMQVLQSLSTLSMDLAVATEDTLGSLPIEQLVHALVECLQKDHIADIVLFAMTCLTNLLDLAPSLSQLIISLGGVGIISAKLANFDFIDMAEHAIKALDKISQENAGSVLKEGAFGPLVTMVDFFETSLQKQIMGIAINIAKSLSSKQLYKECLVPSLSQLSCMLQGAQADKALEFFASLAENLKNLYPETVSEEVDALNSFGILRQAIEIVQVTPSLSEKAFRVIKHICRYSAAATTEFLSCGGLSLLKTALLDLDGSFTIPPAAAEALGVIGALLPSKTEQKALSNENIDAIGSLALPRAIFIYENFGSRSLRSLAVETLGKLIAVSSAPLLLKCVSGSFCNFLAHLLGSGDLQIVLTALEMVTALYENVPHEMASLLAKEGVISRVDGLKTTEAVNQLKRSEVSNLRRLFTSPHDADPLRIEEIMNNIRRGEGLRRAHSDNKDESKQQVLILVKRIMGKHKKYEHKRALQVSRELKNLADRLERGVDIWERLLSLLDVENLSFFEVSQSGLAESLWNWLDFSSKKAQELLAVLSKDRRHLEKLVSLTVGCVSFVQNFTLGQTRPLGKVRTQLEYTPAEPVIHEERHQLFLSVQKFTVNLDLSYDLDELKTYMLQVKNRRDLKQLRFSYRFEDPLMLAEKEARFRHLLQMGFSSDEVMGRMRDMGEMDYMMGYMRNLRNLGRHMREPDEMGGEFEDMDELGGMGRFSHIEESDLILENEAEAVVPRKDSEASQQLDIEFFVNGSPVAKGSRVSDLTHGNSLVIQFRFKSVPRIACEDSLTTKTEALFKKILTNSQEVGLDRSEKAYPYLRLLKLLFQLNSTSAAPISSSEFHSSKLTALLARQLLSPPLPPNSWVTQIPKHCPFLFPFAVRVDYLHVQISDRSRSRSKVSVSRHNLLENALCIFNDVNLLKQGPLDIEYEGEVGTGIGPTAEFYSLISQTVRALPIWKPQQEHGLFPAPIQISGVNAYDHFLMLGRLVAKSIIDRRQIDMPFSGVWWKLVMGCSISLSDLGSIDPVLGKTLSDLEKAEEKYKGMDISELGLFFTLPGYDDIELKPQGASTLVTSSNIEEYVSLVVENTLLQNIQAQAFRKGLEALIPLKTLSLILPEEMEHVLCGDSGESWSIEILEKHVVPDHGYSHNSNTFQHLLVIMSRFDEADKRRFLQFVTGAPRLPLGGFAKMTPKLTVVKKEPSMRGFMSDEYLPSVMTCQNYLKIPDYSSIEVLEQQLRYAMSEGYEAFHLS